MAQELPSDIILFCDGITACECIQGELSSFDLQLKIPLIYLAQAIIYSVELPLSLVGVILNIVFIIRKKTNFLMRVFVYLSISMTFLLGVYWFANIPAFKPRLFWGICSANGTVITSSLPIPFINIAILSSSITIIFLHKLCGSVTCCLRQPWRGPSAIQRTCLEALFVVISLVASVLPYILSRYSEGQVGVSVILTAVLGLPPAAVLLGFISTTVLLVWVCCRRRHIARRGAIILKEIGLFLVYLVVTIAAFVVFCFQLFGHDIRERITLSIHVVALTLLSLFPLCVFVYMRYSFCTPRENRQVGNLNRHDQTAGLQTAPPSTRVSLPSDTAAHAPNFLSPYC